MKDLQLDKFDVRTRKNWLLCLILVMLYSFVTLGYKIISGEMELLANKANDLGISFSTIAFFIYAGLIFSLGFDYLLYHCAYKKHGTAFLTLFFYLVFIGVLLALAPPNNVMPKEEVKGIISYIMDLISNGLSLFLLILSSKLIVINKKIQENIILSSHDYIHSLSILDKALTSEDLETKFVALVRNFPQLHDYLEVLYKNKKTSLIAAISPINS